MPTMTTNPADLELLRSKWGWLLATGIALAFVGLLAVANIVVTTVTSIFFVATMMLVGGAAQIVYGFQIRKWKRSVVWWLSGALYVVAGLFAFVDPLLVSIFLTLPFALSILAAGILRIIAGFSLRPREGWTWMVAAGGFAILIGLAVIFGWPLNSLWLLGALLAFDLFLHGLVLIVLAFALQSWGTPDPA